MQLLFETFRYYIIVMLFSNIATNVLQLAVGADSLPFARATRFQI